MIKIIKGEVIPGRKIWRTIWFPTANIALWKYDIEDGVYKVNIVLDKKIWDMGGLLSTVHYPPILCTPGFLENEVRTYCRHRGCNIFW